MSVYYNEWNEYDARWLANLMHAGHIAAGEVDTRSIEDVRPDDLRGFKQCHFFAGIGVWSYALRQAGWGDDRPVWTGSCPCQPFSSGGERAGFTDERHLWPAFNHLIAECQPTEVLGEQVASKDADPWVDLVQSDLEGLGYAFGIVPFPAAGIGAPTLRERNYWVAVSPSSRLAGRGRPQRDFQWTLRQTPPLRAALRLADASVRRREMALLDAGSSAPARWKREADKPGMRSPVSGFWGDAEWIVGRDGKARPIGPGVSPLAHGPAERMGRLHGYGNAINAEQAIHFVDILMSYAP